ncbi:MAG: fumarylacetoacetate hydrolase family protein [Bacteroidia bacterium]|nr:fumarylacetoacetate hydrolase family protein [Bacteroidia bacterium]
MKIICIGRNYADHAKELNNPLPVEPVFFFKPDSALLINDQPFYYPDFSTDLHYEVEIVLRIGKVGKNISPAFAGRYYDKIGIGIDFTARDLQRKCMAEGLPWEMAKGFDNSAAISKFIPKENFNDMKKINFRLDINDKTVQQGNTRDMVFSFEEIISYVSRFITFKTGDMIYTGTPAGVSPVKIGDNLKAYLGNELMMDFLIK